MGKRGAVLQIVGSILLVAAAAALFVFSTKEPVRAASRTGGEDSETPLYV